MYRSPKLSDDHHEFGANRYEWDWAEGIDQGWPRYQHAVHQALAAQTRR